MDHDPYQPPHSDLGDAGDRPIGEPAGRGRRLLAFVIDYVMLSLPYTLLLIYADFVGRMSRRIMVGEMPYGLMLLMVLIMLAMLLMLQGYPLFTRGQTWGKRLLRLWIIDESGGKPGPVRLILIRYLAFYALMMMPYVGWLVFVVDALFVFRRDRRCLHDLVAGTRVVR